MSQDNASLPRGSGAGVRGEPNPFSTRFIAPGKLPFLFPTGISANVLAERFDDMSWIAQIVGGHGSGKSTATESMLPRLSRQFGSVRRIVFRSESGLTQQVIRSQQTGSRTLPELMLIDGIERPRWLKRTMMLKWLARNRRAAILTTHRKIRGIPVLLKTEPTIEILISLVQRLQSGSTRRLSDGAVREAFDAHGPNLRECLMQLYDVWERER